MKLIVFIPLLLLGTILQAQGKEVEVEVKSGGTRCNGSHGPCFVGPVNEGNAVVWLNNNEFVMKMNRAKLTFEEESKILGKELIEEGKDICEIDSAFILSKDLRDALGLAIETEIPVGEYPVVITKEFVEITFRIEIKD